MKKAILSLLYSAIIALLITSCNNNNATTPEETPIEAPVETREAPQLKPSKYALPDDTVFINDLQIILDSVSIITPSPEGSAAYKRAIAARGNKERMLNVYARITNTGKEAKEIPFLDQIAERRTPVGVHSVMIGGNSNPSDEFRTGSRLFTSPRQKGFVLEVKPKQTITGFYSIKYRAHKHSAISFWYYNADENQNENQAMAGVMKMTQSTTLKGKPVFQIISGSTKVQDVGYDITDLVNPPKQE